MLEVLTVVAAIVAPLACGVAYGYRGQRDDAREQVSYLRKQLAGPPEQSAPAPRSNVPAVLGANR